MSRRGPVLTARDAQALAWVGEMYAARSDTLGVLLGRLGPTGAPVSDRIVRHVTDRWRRAGLIERRPMLLSTWAVPTARGLAWANLSLPPWQPAGTKLRHVHASALVRLAVEQAEPEARWIGERELRQQRATATAHLPDAVVEHGGGRTLVEVELHQKNDRMLADILVNLPRGEWSALAYFCPPELTERLRVQLDRVTDRLPARDKLGRPVLRPELVIRSLPEVAGASYAGRW